MQYLRHQDAPWLSDRMRRRIKDFARVLARRFPTVQDIRTRDWGKTALRPLSGWRHAISHYFRPWELDLARHLIPMPDPSSRVLTSGGDRTQ